MIINHNMMAMNTQRQMGINQGNTSKSIEKLSSGLRINRAGDDAAGLAISEKMRGQIRGLNQASRNAQDGISLVQTAEGALNETQAILQRMRELAVQSSNDTNVSEDRTAIQNEVTQLATEITRIANNTEFNTQSLLDGSFSGTFQIGANASQDMAVAINAMDATTLAVGTGGAATFTGGAVGNTSGDANDAGVTVGLGTYAGDNATGVSFDTSSATVTTTTPYTSLDTNITSSTVTNSYGTLNLTWTDAGGTDGVVQSGEVVIGGADAAGWSITDDTGEQLTLTHTSGDTFVYDATAGNGAALATGVASADFGIDQAGVASTTYGGTVTVGTGADATIFNVAADGSTTAATATDTYAGISVDIGSLAATGSGTGAFDITGRVAGAPTPVVGIDISTQTAANTAITTINDAITTVSSERSKLGATQNRLEHTIKNLETSSENLTAAESRVRDVDMAKEMMAFTKNNILQQAAQSMLAQANQNPQGVLQLLR